MKLRFNPRSYEQLRADGHKFEADEFCYTLDHKDIVFKCRGGKFDVCIVRINYNGPPKHNERWGASGPEDAPTLGPSIACDQRCGWHGTITMGEICP
jgi:hypothetical protein